MKVKKNILPSVFLLLLVIPGFAQIPGKICNWDNDKKAAIVLTFDDWSSGHYYLVNPELQSRNINATFFIPTNAVGDWSQVQTVANNGNEVANHSKSHPNLTTLSATQKQDEIRGAKTLIDQNVTGRTTTTYAYPYGNFNNEVIDSVINSGHIASRGVWPTSINYTYNFAAKNADYYNILTYGMNENTTTDDFYTQIKNVKNGGGLLTYLFHCVVNSSYPCSGGVNLEVFKKQLDTLVYEKEKVWITTFEKAIKYHREKKSASLSEIQAPNGKQWVLNLTDTLSDNNLYNLPLTIKLKMNGVNYNQVIQNGNPVTIYNIKNDTITFRAVPDRGQIMLKASTASNLDIYTDNSSMICTGCTWSSGTLTEESNTGAVEGVKDYLFNYTIQNGWAGLGLNISNWSSAQAKDFSGYDNLQLSYLGPVGSGNASISLSDTSGSSASVNLQTVSNYTTFSIPLTSFTGINLSQITALNISLGGSGSGTLRIDNIKVTASNGGVGSGTILREYWTGISGTSISNLTSNANYPNSPSGSEQLTSLEGPINWADNYGTRIRGYIHPTTSGNYTFWVAGDDNAELYLSTDANPANATRIAYVNGWTNSKEWSKYSTQQSGYINLVTGQKYYVEVLHKEGSGGDNVAVAWQGPGITQQVIGGSFLSPYNPGSIVVRARGTNGDETINLRVDGNTVATWKLGTAYADYTASGSGVVTVHFTNDGSNRDVQIDYVTIGGVTYQSENQAVNTGVWSGTCGGSNSEWLNCGGYISYTTAGSPSAKISSAKSEVSIDEEINSFEAVIYPNPSQGGTFQLHNPWKNKKISILIFDTQGKLVYEQAETGKDQVFVSSRLDNGVYVVKVQSEKGTITRKLIVK